MVKLKKEKSLNRENLTLQNIRLYGSRQFTLLPTWLITYQLCL